MNTWKKVSRVGFILLFCIAFVSGSYGQGLRVLILVMQDPGAVETGDIQNKLMATGQFGTVDVFGIPDATTVGLPTLSYLRRYDAILYYDNGAGAPATGLGTILAQYVDGGGGLVLSCDANLIGYQIDDALNNPTYQVFVPNNGWTGGSGPESTLGAVALPQHPIMRNVTSFDGGIFSYRVTNTTLAAGAYLLASWSDGSPLIAARENVGAMGVRRADLNFKPPSSDIGDNAYWVPITDGAIIMANALTWVAGPYAPQPQLSLEPKIINFGGLPSGDADTLCVTATNLGVSDSRGTAMLKILGIDLSGSSDFSIISGPAVGDSIPAGQASRQFCIRFSPTAHFIENAIFTLHTNGRDSGTQSVTLTGELTTPLVTVGSTALFHHTFVKLGDSLTQYIPVSSSGTGSLVFNSIFVTGINLENYYVSHYPQSPLLPGQSDTIGITFKPDMEGRPDASLVINTDAVNMPSVTIPMFGVGIVPHLVVTPSNGSANTLIFDSVALGDSVCETISLYNPGADTLRFMRQRMEGDPDFLFYPLIGADTMVLPGEMKSVNVCFKPLRSGTRLATVRFYTNIPLTYEHPRRDTSQFVVNVVGTAVPSGQLVFTGPLPDSAEVGKHICVVDTVANIGTAPITITNVAITGPNASEFSLNGIPPLPFSFPVGLKAMNQICFSPQARGLRTANLLITVQGPGREITETIPLAGYGLLGCTSANPSPAIFGANGKTLVGSSDTATITVTNCGDVATTYTAAASPANYTIAGSATSASVVPNGTASFKVVFAPTTVGAYPGTVVFTGGTPDTVQLNGVGAGVTATATGAAGSVGKGACQNFTVTIVNTGTLDWILGTPMIAGANAADFTIVNGPTPDTLPPGDTAMMTLKFCPSIVGSETAALTFPSSSPSPIGGFSYTLTGTGVVNGVSEKTSDQGFELGQSYPNPTTGSAVVMFTLPTDASVRIDLIDAKGSIIRTVFTGRMTSGDHSVTLEAKDLASGTYFYTLTSGDIHLTRQMILVR